MESVQFRVGWPGLTGTSRGLYWTGDLDFVRHDLERDVDSFQAACQRFRERTDDFISRHPENTFGGWPTAMRLCEMHLLACANAVELFGGFCHNLMSAASRLGVVSAAYRDAESRINEIISQLRRRLIPNNENFRLRHEKGDPSVLGTVRHAVPTSRYRFTYEALSYPGKMVGEFSQLAWATSGAAAAETHPLFIVQWLRDLKQATAWEAHYQLAGAWWSITDDLNGLSKRIYMHAKAIDRCWRSISSTAAQAAFRQLEASVHAAAAFSGRLASVANLSASVLQSELENLRIGSFSLTRSLIGQRAASVEVSFGNINSCYRQLASEFPGTLSFHLPFGGVTIPTHASYAPTTDDEANSREELQTPGSPGDSQPAIPFEHGVIGITPPASGPAWDERDNPWDPGRECIPPVIG